MENKDTKKINKTNVTRPIIIAVIICLGLWIGGMFLTHWYANNHFPVDGDNNQPALFGDSFGAVNALISAFAFAGVIVSMYLQRKDLEMQRESLDIQKEELHQNTQELKHQKEELKTQNKTLKLQRFENTFFNMLSMQHEITTSLLMNFSGSTRPVVGKDVFKTIWTRIHITMFNEGIEQRSNGAYNYAKQYGYDHFNEIQELEVLHHYFRHLYRIVKFVDETILLDSKNEKYSYLSILRATLSKYELILLFCNTLSHPHFKGFIEEYSLFNNIETESLPNKIRDKSLYADSAYDPSIKGYNSVIIEREE